VDLQLRIHHQKFVGHQFCQLQSVHQCFKDRTQVLEVELITSAQFTYLRFEKVEMRPFVLLLPLLLVSGAQACINDRDSDSLAIQAKKLPDTLRVITGRFERNPPLYYQMRIRRSLALLKKNPRQFGLYDDIGAAYDRLHRSDEALGIMEKKRALLPPYSAKNPSVEEAWYRYYANAGTFRAHRWLGAGAKVQSLAEMKQARDYIKRAIQIKPNAHFGREKYQLMTMDWIIATRERKGSGAGRLGDWISKRDNWGWGDVNL
jgi:tetratricopeptide (TPR) repeat protein